MGAWYTDQEREEVAYLAGGDDPGPADAWEEMADELRSCVASLRKLAEFVGMNCRPGWIWYSAFRRG